LRVKFLIIHVENFKVLNFLFLIILTKGIHYTAFHLFGKFRWLQHLVFSSIKNL